MAESEFREKLARRTVLAGLEVSETVFEGLETYFHLLRKWNRKISLTSLPVENIGDEALDRLLVEPLLAATHIPRGAQIIDVGSGGGSPAIPLRLGIPEASLTMVESRERKAAFLREAVRTLGLERTSVKASRFQELEGRPEFTQKADAVTVRAVRVEAETMQTLSTFVRAGGCIYLFTTSTTGLSFPAALRENSREPLGITGSHLVILTKWN